MQDTADTAVTDAAGQPAAELVADTTADDATGGPAQDAADQGEGSGDQPEAQRSPWDDPETARKEGERLRKEAAKWRTKYRADEPMAAKARELEEASKTEVQRLAEAQAAAEDRAAQAEQQLLRLQVAADRGLTEAQAKRLVGATREELEIDAEDLLASFPAPKPAEAPVAVARPVEALKAGAAPQSGLPQDPDAWLRRLAGR